MKRFSFRRRLTVWCMLLAAAVLVISGLGASFIVYRRALAELDTEMRAESDHLFAELTRHGVEHFDWRRIGTEIREWMPPENPPRIMELRTPDGVVRYRSHGLAEPGFVSQPEGLRDVVVGKERLRLLVSVQQGITFAIATNLDEAEAAVGDLLRALGMALPVALAFAWFGSRWLAAQAVKPVVEIAAAAEGVTAERLDQRVPVPAVQDEMQRLATVLNATFDRLERSYAQALRFSADASHELRTPLTVLRTSIEALLDSPKLEEADRAAVSGLLHQTQRLANITASLLLLARADAGRLVLDEEEHDISAVVEGCVEDARIMGEERQIRVKCRLPAGARARVDSVRFAQILSNLLDNALKYNRPKGEVWVELEESGNAWRLSVSNTGPGIAPANRARLFERFFRVEHTGEESGQGLGLSLARELARAQGGELILSRSDDDWTEFVLTVPRPAPREGTVQAATAPQPTLS